MNQRGKLVVLLMFITAAGMGGFAWWRQYQGGRRCAAFWGTRAMLTVRYSPRTEVLALAPAENGVDPHTDPTTPRLGIDGSNFVIVQQHDISIAPGLVHARHALVDDTSFDWDHAADDCSPNWEFALRFSDKSEQVTVVFDTHCGWILWLDGNRRARLISSLTDAYRKKRGDWLGQGEGKLH